MIRHEYTRNPCRLPAVHTEGFSTQPFLLRPLPRQGGEGLSTALFGNAFRAALASTR